jgi:tetratricopeptide (TPR) repeat protein
MGGATSGGSAPTESYHVPWKIMGPGAPAVEGSLVVYWFPASPDQARGSSLLTSRYLTLTSEQCVGMALVTRDNADLRNKYGAGEGTLVVLAAKDGTEIGRLVGTNEAVEVEKLLGKEMNRREDEVDEFLDSAKAKESDGDADGAAGLYQSVWARRCMFPGPAKKAAKALKKMGKPVDADVSALDVPEPVFSEPVASGIVKKMNGGLAAEEEGDYLRAKRMYQEAMEMDPGDPVPVRFLAELHRHHTGQWDLARTLFEKVLSMPGDDISRAVALHGLGKMTIHDGEFQKGVRLMEQSLEAYPLALTCRNLAVYWNSERNPGKAYTYVQRAIEIDPDDTYNQIFAATYLVELGRPDEAREVARKHAEVLAASYNLAAIEAQLGNRDGALALLRRHFYVYEQFDAVRAKEMQEARDDIAFKSLHADPEFVKLTAPAETDASSYHRRPS